MEKINKKEEEFKEEWEDLLWHVRLSKRYHLRRVAFFDGYHTFTNVLGVIFGSATMMTIVSGMGPYWIAGASLVVTIFFTIDLIVGTSRKARDHNDLVRRFIELEQDMELTSKPSEDDLRKFRATSLEIEKDERPPLKILVDICHNEMITAYGYKADLVPIGWWKRLFANILSFEPYQSRPTPPSA